MLQGEVGGAPGRAAQDSTSAKRSQTERCGGAPAGVTAPPPASGLSDNPGRLVGQAGRQAGRGVVRAGRQGGRYTGREVGRAGRKVGRAGRKGGW